MTYSYRYFIASANLAVINCGLVIADPTTAENTLCAYTSFKSSGVFIFPSAITGTFKSLTSLSIYSKSGPTLFTE